MSKQVWDSKIRLFLGDAVYTHLYVFADPTAVDNNLENAFTFQADVRAAGVDATPLHSCDEGLAKIGAELRMDDAVLFLTSGDIGGLIERLPLLAETQYPLLGSAQLMCAYKPTN